MHYSGLALVKLCPGLVLRLSCVDPGSSTQALALPRILTCQLHPESTLVLPCTELDPTLFALSLLFGCPCLDKSPNNSSAHGYIRETLRPATHECVFYASLHVVTMSYDAIMTV